MARNLRPMRDQDRASVLGVQQVFDEGDVDGVVIHSDRYTDILTQTSTESAKYFVGHGSQDRQMGNSAFMYAELHATGVGAGTAGDDVDGTYRVIVYADSEDEVPIVGPTFNSGDLRDAVSDNRTERPVLPLLVPGAGKDKSIAVQLKAATGSDGVEVDGAQTNDDVHIPFTQVLE